MKKYLLIFVLLILSSCAGIARQQEALEDKKDPIVKVYESEKVANIKTDSIVISKSYLHQVRTKIGQNWNPPLDEKEAKVRVVFLVNRSGSVQNVKLVEEHSSGTFRFKQAAIREEFVADLAAE